MRINTIFALHSRIGVRVVEWADLESLYTGWPYRGFESLPLRWEGLHQEDPLFLQISNPFSFIFKWLCDTKPSIVGVLLLVNLQNGLVDFGSFLFFLLFPSLFLIYVRKKMKLIFSFTFEITSRGYSTFQCYSQRSYLAFSCRIVGFGFYFRTY